MVLNHAMERFSILDPTIRFETDIYKMEKELKYTEYRLFLKQIVRIFVFIVGISIFVNVLSSFCTQIMKSEDLQKYGSKFCKADRREL